MGRGSLVKKGFTLIGVAFLLTIHGACATAVFGEESSPFAKAVVAYNDRRLDEALHYAKEAVRKDPRHVDAYFLLGELYYLQQDLPDAKENWDRALKLAPSRQDIREHLQQLEREILVEKDLARSDTYPFIVRFAEGEMPVELGDLRQLLREAYRLVGQSFDYFPDHPITVILYPEAGFEVVRKGSHQTAGMYDGKIRLPLRKIDPRYGISVSTQLKRVLWHEYTHALIHDLSKDRCPAWLNEGIASLQESRVYSVSLTEFRKAFKAGKILSWDQLWRQGYDESQLALLYEEAYLIAQYLVKRWDWERMVELLKRLGQGYPINDALRTVYQTDPLTLEKEWLTWVRRNA